MRMKRCSCCFVASGPGVEKPIGEAVLQVDMMLGKERKVSVRGDAPNTQTHTPGGGKKEYKHARE